MHDKQWTKRVLTPALLLVIPAALVALVFSDPRTLSNIQRDFFVVLTGPLQFAWLHVRSTGPVRRSILLILFVVLPVLLLPAYVVTPKKRTCALTIVGVVLWVMSGFLMLALRYVD